MKQVEAIIHDAREVDLEYLRSIRQLERYGYEQIKRKGRAYYQADSSQAIAIREIMCKRIRDNKRIYLTMSRIEFTPSFLRESAAQ